MRLFSVICISLLTCAATMAHGTDENVEEFDVSLPDISGEAYETPVNKIFMPWVLKGYRHITKRPRFSSFMEPKITRSVIDQVWRHDNIERADTIGDDVFADNDSIARVPSREELPIAFGSVIPSWLTNSARAYNWQEDFMYNTMVHNPNTIEYAYWDLPERPVLPEEDTSFLGYLQRLNIPKIEPDKELPVEPEIEHTNWLHVFNLALQLSQSYISGNWYQGGTSYLAFFGNFLWDVQLNQVYHPNTMFQSTVSYKLAINSTPDDRYHKYQVSQDLFQYNLKAGYKAYHHWYYSFVTQFKTQFLNSYPTDSPTRVASFLSPSELNLGIGMTYSKENQKKTVKFSATVSPLSYNLITCIDPKVDGTQFGLTHGKKTLSEIGSNAEVNFMAKIWGNTTYTTRVFFFTDYSSLTTDWENTLNFQFSKFFSTQIYAHLRYDTKADPNVSRKWGKLMLKEILSVGLSYQFTTK